MTMTASRPAEHVLSPTWRRALALGGAYFLCAEAGRFLSVPDSTYVSFWLPAGLYVAALLLSERHAWPALVAAAFAANVAFDLVHGTPVAATLCFALANAVQSVASAWLVRRFVAPRPTLFTLRELVGFLCFSAVLGSAVGATIGAASLVAFGFSESFVQSWKVWWGSNAMAILLLSPLILTWSSGARAGEPGLARPGRILEAALVLLLLAAITGHLLGASSGVMAPDKERVVFPLLWAGLRFGPRGAAAANLLLAVSVAFFTTQFHAGLTPAQIASGEYVFVMQVSLAVAALVALIPAIVLDERDRRMAELRESEAQLRLSVHASNVGLWDWDIRRDRLYLSPEWKSQLGYRDEEIPNRYEEWRDRLHAEDRERVLPKVKAYLADPSGNYEVEFRLRHKDGSYRWIYARAQVECDAEGRPQRMLGCHIDVTERKRAEEELQKSFTRMRELSRRLVEVEESERRNINRELHDRVGQNLSALGLSLGVLRGAISGRDSPELSARLDDARTLLEMTSTQVRDVMAELRPAALDDYGLIAALRHHVAVVAARTGVAIAVEGAEPAPRLPAVVETALFRIAQEALNNVAKHARAHRVKVALDEAGGQVRLAIADDGAGFDAARRAPDAPTYGIVTMHERAEAVGARLRITSAPGHGTRVEVEVARSAA